MGVPYSTNTGSDNSLYMDEHKDTSKPRLRQYTVPSKSSNDIMNLLFDNTPFKTLEADLPDLDLTVKLEGVEKKEPIRLSDGSFYKGEWNLQGQKHGRGIEIRTTGSKYEGYFENNLPNGKGRFSIPNVQVYQGDFTNGKANGVGLLRGPLKGSLTMVSGKMIYNMEKAKKSTSMG